MQMLIKTGAGCCLVLVLAGCGDNPVTITPPPGDYFPMTLGDWWEYAYSTMMIEPDSILWEEGSEHLAVISVAGDTCVVEYTFSLWVAFGEVQEDTLVQVNTLTYLVNADSVVYFYSDSVSNKILDYPLEQGKTWDDWTVVDMDADVVTPTGLFEGCADISTYNELHSCYSYYYYSPGTGMIKKYELGASSWSDSTKFNIVYELTGSSYCP